VAGLTVTPHPRWLDTPPEAKSAAAGLLKAFGAAMIPVVFSYGGWQTANYVAGEMKDSRRNLGRALVLGVTAVIVLYLLINLACVRVLGMDALGRTLTPASDVLEVAVGPVGAKLAAGAIALSALAFLSQGMLTGPRVTFAMARDGLFFRSVGAIAEGNRAPVVAILLLAAWTAVLALSGSYEQILSYVTAMNFLFFGLTAAGLFVLRARERRGGMVVAEGFRTPLQPVTTGLFILACVMVVGFSLWAFPINSLVGYGILLLGVPPYLYWRSRPPLEPAPT
jgi:APA family basic amino acid/polyamine antiporter